jgi:4-amino-4-deoxy-L-arabinose transferase-like glycosyltransferase
LLSVAGVNSRITTDLVANRSTKTQRATVALIILAGATLLLHVLVGNRYGFHRDELATLDDARHLAWGYVAYPPVTPFFGWLSLQFFGTSLAGFRFFAALAGAISIILTGLMARDLGAPRSGQLLAALAITPVILAIGSLMQYVSFDYLAWVAVAYFVVRLCRTGNPRWWLAVGAAIGFGTLSKYSMPFLVAGIAVGVLTNRDLRAHLGSKWLRLGAALAFLIFLPNFIWQWRNNFISLDFLRHIHARDIRIGRTETFLPDQLEIILAALPLALAGLYFYFFSNIGRPFRVLGWMFVIPLVLFLLGKGRGYYLAPAYPMLYAAGVVSWQTWLRGLRPTWRTSLIAIFVVALLANIALSSAIFLNLAPINSRWWKAAVNLNSDLPEEIGWPELAETVARIRNSLPAEERAQVKILAGNYGEAGAINLYGPPLGLPPVICPTNSFWERGYGDSPPEILIVLGASAEDLDGLFESCQLVGHITNREGVANEETTRHPDIFLCRHLRRPWPEVWKKNRRFG